VIAVCSLLILHGANIIRRKSRLALAKLAKRHR
jgi:hypothetical protein